MAKLEEITVGSSVKGIISNSTVTIVAVQWYGNNELIYQEILGYLKEKNADSEADTVQLEEE